MKAKEGDRVVKYDGMYCLVKSWQTDTVTFYDIGEPIPHDELEAADRSKARGNFWPGDRVIYRGGTPGIVVSYDVDSSPPYYLRLDDRYETWATEGELAHVEDAPGTLKFKVGDRVTTDGNATGHIVHIDVDDPYFPYAVDLDGRTVWREEDELTLVTKAPQSPHTPSEAPPPTLASPAPSEGPSEALTALPVDPAPIDPQDALAVYELLADAVAEGLIPPTGPSLAAGVRALVGTLRERGRPPGTCEDLAREQRLLLRASEKIGKLWLQKAELEDRLEHTRSAP